MSRELAFNRAAFREVRDRFFTDTILQRKADLEQQSAAALKNAKRLRKIFKAMPKGHKRDFIEKDYDTAMAQWAALEVHIGNIERDSRYIAYMAKLQE